MCLPGRPSPQYQDGYGSLRHRRTNRSEQDAFSKPGWRRHRRLGEPGYKDPAGETDLHLILQGGYTPIQGGRTLYGFGGTVGERFGVDKKLGILVGATYDHNNRGIDDLEPTQAIGNFNNSNFAYINSEDFRTYHYDRTRYGFNGDIDYNIKPGTTIYVKGLWADFHDYGSTFVYTPNVGAITGHDGADTTFDDTGNMQFREYICRPDQGVYSVVVGATHGISPTTILNYQFAISKGFNYGGQDFATTNFSGPAGVQFGLSEATLSAQDLAGGWSQHLRSRVVYDHANCFAQLPQHRTRL